MGLGPDRCYRLYTEQVRVRVRDRVRVRVRVRVKGRVRAGPVLPPVHRAAG